MTIETSTYKFPSPEDSESPNGPAQIKALTDKLEATKWLSQSLKPTVGVKEASGSAALGTSYADVTGVKLEITPAVASNLLVVSVPSFTEVQEGNVYAVLNVDGVVQSRAAFMGGAAGGVKQSASPAQAYVISLTAAAHTIKMQAKRENASGSQIGIGSMILYALFAS